MRQLSPTQRSAWADHIQSQRTSGLSQQAYCTRHGLKAHQFSYWKHQLASTVNEPSKSQAKSVHRDFVPVNVVAPSSTGSLTVTLPNGIQLNGISEHNLTLVQQLIGALQ